MFDNCFPANEMDENLCMVALFKWVRFICPQIEASAMMYVISPTHLQDIFLVYSVTSPMLIVTFYSVILQFFIDFSI